MRGRLIELAIRRRLTVIGGCYWAGDLFSYGEPLRDKIRRSAYVVDRILKGAKPADIPVEQPIKFALVSHLKAARALGITIPQSLLLRADEVVQ
jgi:putative ABC transport system substrate-binding protein